MATTWPAPLQHQVQVLLDNFLTDPPALIGTASIEDLRRASLMRTARIEPLSGYTESRAFVLVTVATNEQQLWVDPDDNSYRDMYRLFARTRLNVTAALDGDTYNFDHMFPRTAGALDGLSHVRMIAIAPRPNQSAGRTLEKRMAQRARNVAGGKVLRSATWMTIGKAAGFEGWESLPGENATANQAMVTALFAHLASIGITPPAGALEHGMTAGTLGKIR
ncbi:MAG: hypothetical protein JWO26_827 [Rhodospirillales bacterium]|nr:hypothetical protein [Rhodospirillales bacterium]